MIVAISNGSRSERATKKKNSATNRAPQLPDGSRVQRIVAPRR